MLFRHAQRLAAYPIRRPGAVRCPWHFDWRQFHISHALLQDDVDDAARSHYETLNVRPDASSAEIKKSFYTLSKAHHPDHNPSDPAAPRRFMRLSAAYSVLSSPEKRAVYDRQHGHQHHHRHPSPHHKGSYYGSSQGPAGGRPASGLSRRRGTFTGPPPSFYRNGGWGGQSAKRAAAHEESTGGAGSSSSDSSTTRPSSNYGAGAPGMGPGEGRRHEDVPHFDRVSHERTHRTVRRRRSALSEEAEWAARGRAETTLAKFILVSAALTVGVFFPMMLFSAPERRTNRS